MRSSRLALGLALALLIAGCASRDTATTASVSATGTLRGIVTDASLAPIVGASVRVEGPTHLTLTTDAAGSFAAQVAAAEYLVIVSAEGKRGEAQRAQVDAGGVAKLAFIVTPIPTEAPTVDVAEAHGLLSCSGAIVNGNRSTSVNCGSADPNQRASLKFPMGNLPPGLTAVVIEVDWQPTTQGTNVLELSLLAGKQQEELGRTDGSKRMSIVIPASQLPAEGDLVSVVSPTGSFTDEEAAVNGGFAFQQPFTVYASYFYHAAPPAGYIVGK